MERETGKQRSLVKVLGARRTVPPCDWLAQPGKGLTAPSLLQLFELYSSILKYFPGSHRQIYKNLQEINVFIGRSVEQHRETLDPNAPRDFIDCYLLRMEKVGFGRGNGGGREENKRCRVRRDGKGVEQWREGEGRGDSEGGAEGERKERGDGSEETEVREIQDKGENYSSW